MSSASENSRPQRTESRPLPPASRRRDKPQLSCNACRRRKGRCDRRIPCSSCLTRGIVCTYPDNHASPQGSQPATLPIQGRLEQLERLVISMIPDSAAAEGNSALPEDADESRATQGAPSDVLPGDNRIDRHSECGSMRVSASELSYVGGDHWAAILDRISDLKNHFDSEGQLYAEPTPGSSHESLGKGSSSRALLLYGCPQATSQGEILASLPSRSVVDRHVSGYFNRLDLVSSSAVHGPTFLRQYEAFWTNPSDAPIMWIGLLFSMMCLAVQASSIPENGTSQNGEQHRHQIELYREKVIQCLLMGEYTKSGPYVLETVIHYVYIEFCLHPDADRDIWFLLSLEISLARRMGYHRDPCHFPGISPFQGEMRRRLWATVLLGDVLISSQMGLPRMISDWQCDTAEPRNLNDSDLQEDSLELPASRPESENTTALGLIARRRMVMALGRISDLAAAVETCSYAEVMHVDGVLHEAADSIPLPFKMKPMAASLTDSPRVIMERLFIRHMFYKGQLILHRRYLFQDSTSREMDRFAYSRDSCIDASLGLLDIQKILDEETGPDGQLQTMHWRITSILNHQFLTATMILCSLLYREHTLRREQEIRDSLQRCRTIWIRRSPGSEEARKAADAVGLVLSRTTAEGDGTIESVLDQGSQQYGTDLLDQFAILCQGRRLQPIDSQQGVFPFTSTLAHEGEYFDPVMPMTWPD